MKARRAETRRALLLPLALGASGCQDVELGPCFGLRLDEPLEIRIVSEYSEAAGYDFELRGNPAAPLCPASLRLTPGGAIDVQVVAQQDEDHQSCDSNSVQVRGGSGLALGAQTAWLAFGTEDISEILHATHLLTHEGCPGSWGFSVESRTSRGADGQAFVPAPESGFPPIIMHLGFTADPDARDTAECLQLLGTEASICTDYYVVELHRP